MAEEKQKEEVKKEAPKAVPKPAAKPVSDDAVVEEGKALAWLSYIGILFLVPLLAKKDNAFCMHHAKQGLVYFIIEFCLAILLVIPFFVQYIQHQTKSRQCNIPITQNPTRKRKEKSREEIKRKLGR